MDRGKNKVAEEGAENGEDRPTGLLDELTDDIEFAVQNLEKYKETYSENSKEDQEDEPEIGPETVKMNKKGEGKKTQAFKEFYEDMSERQSRSSREDEPHGEKNKRHKKRYRRDRHKRKSSVFSILSHKKLSFSAKNLRRSIDKSMKDFGTLSLNKMKSFFKFNKSKQSQISDENTNQSNNKIPSYTKSQYDLQENSMRKLYKQNLAIIKSFDDISHLVGKLSLRELLYN